MPTKFSTRKPLPIDALDLVTLKAGGHDKRSLDSLCILEAVAWIAGREHSDRPPCVSNVIAAFLRAMGLFWDIGDDVVSEDEGVRRLESVRDELQAFVQDVVKGRR